MKYMVRQTFSVSTPLAAVLTGLTAVSIYSLLLADLLGQKACFTMFTFLLIFYLSQEIIRVRRVQPVRWLFNPAVLCSITTFILYFGVTNILYYLPAEYIYPLGLSPTITPGMNKLMFLVILAAIAMWLGYWSAIAKGLLHSRYLVILRNNYFSADVSPRFWVVPTLYLIANLCRLIEVWLGIYGYSSNYQDTMAAATYSQYLILGDNLGLVALIIVALEYYKLHPDRLVKFYFVSILILEIFWGLLSGMKSGIMIPFICVLIVQYLRRGQMLKKWLIVVPIVVLVAYGLVDPFRNERNLNPNFESTSVSGIVSAIIGAQQRKYMHQDVDNKDTGENSNIIKQEQDVSILLKLMSRLNLTYTASVGIDFADRNKILPSGSPDFTKNLFEAPMAAFVPRFLWTSKAVANIGIWYTQVVMGKADMFSSTAMSILANLYFSGGVILVIVGFYMGGILQRIIFFTTQPWISAAGAIVYLSLMTKLAIIAEADFQTILAYTFRIVPIILIFQSLIYNHFTQNVNK